MIWVDGRIVAEDALTLPAGDRLFEHGLGLFETFRTWNSVAPLLDRHLGRIIRSSRTLGIPLDPARLPTPEDVACLTQANHHPDAMVRLTISGGQTDARAAACWMTARPLPPAAPPSGYRVVDAPWPVAVEDVLCRHKTLNYWSKRFAHERALTVGADEAIFSSADGRFWEGSRTNLFLILGHLLVTPPASGPIVPGIWRQLVLDRAEVVGLQARERDINRSQVESADAIFLTNSVRGIIPVREWLDRHYRPSDPEFAPVVRLDQDLRATLSFSRRQP